MAEHVDIVQAVIDRLDAETHGEPASRRRLAATLLVLAHWAPEFCERVWAAMQRGNDLHAHLIHRYPQEAIARAREDEQRVYRGFAGSLEPALRQSERQAPCPPACDICAASRRRPWADPVRQAACDAAWLAAHPAEGGQDANG